MRKICVSLLMLMCVVGLSSCEAPSYIKNQFYSDETLQEGLVPNLPKPNGEYLYRTGTSIYCDKIYISSDETIDEYFTRILDYIQEDEYKIIGTINWVKSTTGDLFLNDDSYVFKPTNDILEPTTNDYYNASDVYNPYYSIIISNNDIQQGDYHEPYQHPENEEIYIEGYYDYYFTGTLIRLCIDDDKTIEYDDGSFEYDYYLEVRVNELLWMDHYSYQPQN